MNDSFSLMISKVYSHNLFVLSHNSFYEWEITTSFSFNELILSWNVYRPLCGYYRFWISVKIENVWIEWLLYADWGTTWQKSFQVISLNSVVYIYQDILEIKAPYYATSFKIRMEAVDGAHSTSLSRLHVCVSDLNRLKSFIIEENADYPFISLDVPGLSQLALTHPRNQSLCSPTSMTVALRYLLNQPKLDAIQFAHQVWDSECDMFGHWVFNVAQAFVHLGENWQCYVARLNGFKDIIYYLLQDLPVIVSIKGSLEGSLFPYHNGHLIVVRGYDPLRQHVLCMDPAYPEVHQTLVSYSLIDFYKAWLNRNLTAYLFYK